ncbi:MAG: PACE efflux transporter [Gammaproteobacteria bacterium]|nr:PACE efflux transporter [Gammaproteobacteria bacterium]
MSAVIMEKAIKLRTGKDRLRYTCLFELFLIVILAPISALVLQEQIVDVGVLAVLLSLKAMLFNLVYNWFFDHFDARAGRIPTDRTFFRRILHAVGFEISLLITSLPIVVWWLGLSILQALLMDIVVTSFVVLYTLVFTWGYDRLFPVVQMPINRSRPVKE